MRRAELKKAEANAAPLEQVALLKTALEQAERDLHAAEDACGKPAPELVRREKRPIDQQLRTLKTELAYARAELGKLQRNPETPAHELTTAQHRLEEAQRQVDAHVAP